jgi:hypothetical protein
MARPWQCDTPLDPNLTTMGKLSHDVGSLKGKSLILTHLLLGVDEN